MRYHRKPAKKKTQKKALKPSQQKNKREFKRPPETKNFRILPTNGKTTGSWDAGNSTVVTISALCNEPTAFFPPPPSFFFYHCFFLSRSASNNCHRAVRNRGGEVSMRMVRGSVAHLGVAHQHPAPLVELPHDAQDGCLHIHLHLLLHIRHLADPARGGGKG